MDESALRLQSKLEQKISEWSLYRIYREKKLKNLVLHMVLPEALILVEQTIYALKPQFSVLTYSNLMTIGLAFWLIVLAIKYYIGYNDKKCAHSASEITQLAAEYNDAVKDVPEARYCYFLPPEFFRHKKVNFGSKIAQSLASLSIKI